MGHLPNTFEGNFKKSYNKFSHSHNNSNLTDIIGTMQKAATPKRLRIYNSIKFQKANLVGL